jgi:hypothetical protein
LVYLSYMQYVSLAPHGTRPLLQHAPKVHAEPKMKANKLHETLEYSLNHSAHRGSRCP